MRKTVSFIITTGLLFILASASGCSKKPESTSPTPGSTDTATNPQMDELPTFIRYKDSLRNASANGDREAANLLDNIEKAENGNKDAQFWLGANFRDGTLFKKDDAEAFKLFSAAAEQGQQGAQWFLGVMYEHGESVPVDLEKARHWYTQSAQGPAKEWADRGKHSLAFLKAKK